MTSWRVHGIRYSAVVVSLTVDTLSVANDLRQFGEDAAASWVESCTDDEFVRVSNAASFVYNYGPTSPSGNSMILAKACAIGAVYVYEGAARRLALGRRDTRRPLPERPAWLERRTNAGLQRFYDEFYGVGDDFVSLWAESPDAARARLAEARAAHATRLTRMPSVPTHVVEYGAERYRVELNDWARPVGEQWRWILGRMDGDDNAIVSTWALPAGMRLGFFDPDAYDTGYLQSAGAADRLSVEVRRLEGDEWCQYAVGKPGAAYTGEPAQRIRYGEHTVEVHEGEVFTADEAAPIYEAYRVTGHVPDTYRLRKLDV